MKSRSDRLSKLEGGLTDPFLPPGEASKRLEEWWNEGVVAAAAPMALWAALQEAQPKLRRIGLVAFPSGGQTNTGKRVELLECVRMGLHGAEVVLNGGCLAEGLWGEVEKEMRDLLKTAPEIELRFAVEWGRLGDEARRRLVRLLKDNQPKVLRAATGVYGPALTFQEVASLRAMLPKGVRLKLPAGKDGPPPAKYLDAGADLVESETPLSCGERP